MPVLLNCQDLSKSYGAEPLFEDLSLAINDGDRLGLIGPNGSGKSTLLEILAGRKDADTGVCSLRKQARVSFVPQEPSFPEGLTVRRVLLEALADDASIEQAEKTARIEEMTGRAGFRSGDAEADSLSGGWRKRLAIARALVQHPDLLLLDEPTNHLDLDGILWLERYLAGSPFACVVVSHDRYFLENMATGMAELNRMYPGGLFRVNGNYSRFLERKDEFLLAQAKQQESLETKVRRELEWLRRGPKARTGKSKARIDEAHRLIGELGDITSRGRTATTTIDFTATGRQTKRLLEARKLTKAMGGRTLFRELGMVLRPGTRLGLVGPNGSGKTTLLRILAGELQPDSGEVDRADALQTVYFDQGREQLDPDATLKRSLAPEGDSVIYRGRPIHVNAWASRFLFRKDQLELPVARLSGGERARVLIARLMLQPADLLLLDEPTNDLDIPTLETLEESLSDFTGALVLVTHDRYMLDRVSNVVIGLDGEGGSGVFADYSQWEQDRAERSRQKTAKEPARERQASSAPAKKRLSYLEAREWETIEERLLEAERTLEEKKAAMQAPEVVSDPFRLQHCYDEMTAAQAEVDKLYQRWAELEDKQST